jgi:metallophosphoesterase superfamily enzyme
MKSLYIINDLHIGAVRTTGCTPETAYKLRQELLEGYRALLGKVDSDLIINGDMFDSSNISLADLLSAFQITCEWLGKGHKLFASKGNHDNAKNSTNYASFEMFCRLLEHQFPVQVQAITEGTLIRPDMYVLPHVQNQDTFNAELAKVPACDYLFLHCNYDNNFAVESDHSLNLSEAQAKDLPVKHLVFAHEHQAKTALNGKVVIAGNQFPSSVSDCLGNETKRMLKITDTGIESIETWSAEGDYSEQDWQSLEDTGRFIRVVGKATAEQAAQVISAIAKFRSSAKALVITNAVKVEGVSDQEDLELSHEEITSFDVMSALLDLLTPEEGTKIKALLGATK